MKIRLSTLLFFIFSIALSCNAQGYGPAIEASIDAQFSHYNENTPGSFTLRPVMADGFLSDSWRFSFLNFERDAAGVIQGFRTSSGRVRRMLFKRI